MDAETLRHNAEQMLRAAELVAHDGTCQWTGNDGKAHWLHRDSPPWESEFIITYPSGFVVPPVPKLDAPDPTDAMALICAVHDHHESEMPQRHPDGPGHAHKVPGIWDGTGEPCEWCATWNRVRECVRRHRGEPQEQDAQAYPHAAQKEEAARLMAEQSGYWWRCSNHGDGWSGWRFAPTGCSPGWVAGTDYEISATAPTAPPAPEYRDISAIGEVRQNEWATYDDGEEWSCGPVTAWGGIGAATVVAIGGVGMTPEKARKHARYASDGQPVAVKVEG